MTNDFYALYCKPRQELTAEYHVTAAGADVFFPKRRNLRPKHPAQAIGPLFPGYIFARGLAPSVLRYLQGVIDLVRSGGERDTVTGLLLPVTVPELLIDRIKDKLDEQGILISEAKPASLQIGDKVTVTAGPLTGLLSHILAIDNSSEVKIWCDLLGGAPVVVPKASVERLDVEPTLGRTHAKAQLSASFAA